jgi:hypothetical protein
MKTRKARNELLAVIIGVGALAAALTVWDANQAGAVIAIIRQTGNFSIAQGQATTAHVVNATEEGGIVINWRVLDSQGNVHSQSDRRRVEQGQASSFDFRPLDLADGQRMTIRFELTVEGAHPNKLGFIGTQEVFNVADGKTTVFLPYVEQ